MSDEPVETTPPVEAYLVGVRVRRSEHAEDHRLDPGLHVHVGDVVIVETPDGEAPGEVRRPRRPLPAFKADRAFPAVLRRATPGEAQEHQARREREERAVGTCRDAVRAHGLPMKVVAVEMHPTARRATVYFNAEGRVDFRGLVRDLARQLHARVEMRQVGARDTTRLMDGIGPCGQQLCCASHLRAFESISVKMAKAQDMPLTDTRLLGACGRLKCCLLYEFSLYDELRQRLPRVNTPCQATCGGGGCMAGRVRALRVLKQVVVVAFEDGTEAEVPIDQVTWEGRAHVPVPAQPPASSRPDRRPATRPRPPRPPGTRP